MLDIKKTNENGNLKYELAGRLDTKTAPDFETELKSGLGEAESLVIDMSGLDYISSAGLRVVLYAKKQMKNKEMVIENVNESIMEIFNMTGFADILDIR
jgi:anti-sigma B factor antagonist